MSLTLLIVFVTDIEHTLERIKVEVNSFLQVTEPSTPLSFSPSVATYSPLAGTAGSQFNSPDRRSPRGEANSPRRSASPRREGTRLQNPVIVSVSLEAMKSVMDWIERRSAVMSIEVGLLYYVHLFVLYVIIFMFCSFEIRSS
jgi:hypothetical protein